MIVEVVLKEDINLEFERYEKIEAGNNIVFANPIEKRVEIFVKRHPDGKVSVFTDKADIIKKLVETGKVFDIHVR